MPRITLTQEEMQELFRQDPDTKGAGGFQALLVQLQGKVKIEINLEEADLERIPRYAFDYKQGGWQNLLLSIFRRTLGDNLGR